MMTTSQKWGAVETTPNHSVYARDGQTFYPHERREVMAVRALEPAARLAIMNALSDLAA